MNQVTATGFISAFPGTGKSSIYGNAPKNGLWPLRKEGTFIFRGIPQEGSTRVYDSDSSTFDKADFPGNYIQHMKDVVHRHAGEEDFLFLGSSHDNVREAMQNAGLPYVVVYPDRSLKSEYLERYIKRSSPPAFIELMNKNWDAFIDSCEADPNTQIVLQSGQYLSDVL